MGGWGWGVVRVSGCLFHASHAWPDPPARCSSLVSKLGIRFVGSGAEQQTEIVVDRNSTVRQLKRKIGEMYHLEQLTIAKV